MHSEFDPGHHRIAMALIERALADACEDRLDAVVFLTELNPVLEFWSSVLGVSPTKIITAARALRGIRIANNISAPATDAARVVLPPQKSTVKIERGIRLTRYGYQTYTAVGGPYRSQRFPRGTSMEVMRRWLANNGARGRLYLSA